MAREHAKHVRFFEARFSQLLRELRDPRRREKGAQGQLDRKGIAVSTDKTDKTLRASTTARHYEGEG